MTIYGIISTIKCWQKPMSYQPPCHNCFHLTITFKHKATKILIYCWKQTSAWQWIPLIKSKSLGFFSYKIAHCVNLPSDQTFYILIRKPQKYSTTSTVSVVRSTTHVSHMRKTKVFIFMVGKLLSKLSFKMHRSNFFVMF
jgi:hypothetical protein